MVGWVSCLSISQVATIGVDVADLGIGPVFAYMYVSIGFFRFIRGAFIIGPNKKSAQCRLSRACKKKKNMAFLTYPVNEIESFATIFVQRYPRAVPDPSYTCFVAVTHI